MTAIRQLSLAAGELAPALYARCDQVRYSTGARILRNFTVMRSGGVRNRPGSTFIAETHDATKKGRLVPFSYGGVSYLIELGDKYAAFYLNGAPVFEAGKAITGFVAGTQRVTAVGSNYATGDVVYITGVVGTIELNGRFWKVTAVDADHFQIRNMDGSTVDTTGWGAYVSGGTAYRQYVLATPWAVADLAALDYAQYGKTMTFTHTAYDPYELTYTSATSWTLLTTNWHPHPSVALQLAGFALPAILPVKTALTAGGAGTHGYRYAVTTIRGDTGEEGYPWTEYESPITGITNASPAVVTLIGHGYANGEEVYIFGAVGMVEVNYRRFVVANKTANTFELKGVDSTSYGVYVSGGAVARFYFSLAAAAVPTLAAPIVVGVLSPAADGDVICNVYRADDGGPYGFIGSLFCPAGATVTFNDIGFTPDLTHGPPVPYFPFVGVGNRPAAVCYYQQRRFFAGSLNAPQTVIASRIGLFANFFKHDFVLDDDPVVFTIPTQKTNAVRHMLDLRKLLVFGEYGEFVIEGDAGGAITPTAVNPQQTSYNGSSGLKPIVANGDGLYVQARQSIVRDIEFQFVVDAYRGNDLTVFSSHLVEGHTISAWSYQQTPDSIVWMVRDDGALLGMTYIREQEMLGWHRHDFATTSPSIVARAEDVCVLPEGTRDVVYVLVAYGTVDPVTGFAPVKRYILKLDERFQAQVRDYNFTDCSLGYNGWNADGTHTQKLTAADYHAGLPLTITANFSAFTAAEVGNAIHFVNPGTSDIYRAIITAYTNATTVTAVCDSDIPAGLQAVAITNWARAVDQLAELWHLLPLGAVLGGVSVYADGFVVANPNNPDYALIKPSAKGVVTLPEPYAVVRIGLPMTSDLMTLDIDTAQGETMMGKRKLVTNVTLYVEKSRGIWTGQDAPATDVLDSTLRSPREREEKTAVDKPPDLFTGVLETNIKGRVNESGRVFVRQSDPLPLSILAVTPQGYVVPQAAGQGG